jgi:hypothetical protein
MYIEGRKPAFGPCGDIIGGTAGFALVLMGGVFGIGAALKVIDLIFGTNLLDWFAWLISVVTFSR